MIIVVMGVAGSGKTTIGSMLAEELGWEFYDADDFHSAASHNKMSQSVPLTDSDRVTWLAALQGLIQDHLQEGASCVLACSALKESYRAILNVDEQVKFVHLKGTYAEIESRLKNRTGHYMSVKLLSSQFETLEEPADALTVNITHTSEEIIRIIRKGLAL